MPRGYKRGDKKNKWTTEQLEAAVAAVKSGQLKPYRAALQFGVPSSTLHDHLTGKSKKRYGGRPTVLSSSEEKEIVRICETLQQVGFPLTRDIVGAIIRDYLTDCGRPNPFRDSIPQNDWRWPIITERKQEHLPKCRAKCAGSKKN